MQCCLKQHSGQQDNDLIEGPSILSALVTLLSELVTLLSERVALISEVGDLLAEPGGIPAEAGHLALDGGGGVGVVVVVVVHDFLPEKIFAQSKKGQPSAPFFR